MHFAGVGVVGIPDLKTDLFCDVSLRGSSSTCGRVGMVTDRVVVGLGERAGVAQAGWPLSTNVVPEHAPTYS